VGISTQAWLWLCLSAQVATVAIGNAANAGLLAVRIIGSHNPELLDKMIAYQDGMREMVTEKAARLEKQGWRDYKLEGH
jgi:phosphoribosylcarboxyaminoimidazole (NCAIR) mutase